MQDINTQFESIRQKVRGLTTIIQELQVKYDNVKSDNENLTLEVNELNKKIEELENKNLNLHLLQKASDEEKAENEALKKRLDAFITEIDECIAQIRG
jgi:chromosome segregation ATPase